MTKRKTNIDESLQTNISNDICIPQLWIPYEIINPGIGNSVPRQIDEGLFYIRSPYKFSINPGKITTLKTNLKFHLPKFIDVSTPKKSSIGNVVFPRMIIHVHIDSIYEKTLNNGLLILGPKTLSAAMLKDRELEILIQNIGKTIFSADVGDEIAALYLTVTPVSTLKLVFEQGL